MQRVVLQMLVLSRCRLMTVNMTSPPFFFQDSARSFSSMLLLNNHAYRSHGYVSTLRS